jgi:hypothetical protein
MSLQKKYFYSFKDINNQSYTVEIWQNTTASITALEVTGAVAPFVIDYPAIDTKLAPVHSSAGALNLMATSTNDFLSLYTGKVQEFMIKCFKGFNLIHCSYLDPELYSSDFSMIENYVISFTSTDFGILERINYVTPSNIVLSDSGFAMIEKGLIPYSGLSTQWTVLTNIFTKLGLPFNDIRVGLSITSNDFTIGSYETIFHKTYVINSNYVNESNEPETCRKVLEAILKPYGAFITQVNGSIYITDLNYIANNNIQPFEGFYASNYTGLGVAYINLNLGDLTNIGFKSDQSQLDIISAVNKVVVSYSNYKGVNVLDYSSTDFTGLGISSALIGTTNYQWTKTPYSTSASWTKSNNGRFYLMKGYGVQSGTTDSYLSTSATTNINLMVNKSFTYVKDLPYIIPTGNYKLKIEMSAYFRSTDNLNKNSDSTKQVFNAGRVMAKIKIGNKYLTGKDLADFNYNALHSNHWTTTNDYSVGNNFAFYFYNASSTGNVNSITANDIADQWVDFKDVVFVNTKGIMNNDYLVDLANITGGNITLDIYDAQVWGVDPAYPYFTVNPNGTYLTLKEVRIKDIKLTIVDSNGKDLNIADTEYYSNMSPEYKDEQKVELIQGTNVTNCPIEKASLLYWNGTRYDFCKTWNRASNNNILEKLLQNTIKSNYLTPTIQLSATVNNLPSLVGCVTYSNHLAGKIFMITGAKLNLEDASTELTIAEVSQDVWNIT